jgi:hypothetical protein
MSFAPQAQHNMTSLEVPGNRTDKRASRALSVELSIRSMVRIVPPGTRTLWAMAKMLGNSATRKGSLVIENSFPNPFGINELEFPPDITSKQASELDPEKAASSTGIQKEKIPPCDSGRRAWACLLGAATIEGLMWGMFAFAIPALEADPF